MQTDCNRNPPLPIVLENPEMVAERVLAVMVVPLVLVGSGEVAPLQLPCTQVTLAARTGRAASGVRPSTA